MTRSSFSEGVIALLEVLGDQGLQQASVIAILRGLNEKGFDITPIDRGISLNVSNNFTPRGTKADRFGEMKKRYSQDAILRRGITTAESHVCDGTCDEVPGEPGLILAEDPNWVENASNVASPPEDMPVPGN